LQKNSQESFIPSSPKAIEKLDRANSGLSSRAGPSDWPATFFHQN